VFFKLQHAQHGSVARSADGGRVVGAQRVGQGRQPTGIDASLLSQPAPVLLADVPAVDCDLIACLPVGVLAASYSAGQVDAWNHRPVPDDAGAPSDG